MARHEWEKDDAEDFFRREYARLYRRSAETEMESLRRTYKQAIMISPFKDCSAWAEEILWELDRMQRKESKEWRRRQPREKRRLKMALTWLRRVGVQDVEYHTVMPLYWEDIALLLFLEQNWGLRRAYPTLTLAVLGDMGSEYDKPKNREVVVRKDTDENG